MSLTDDTRLLLVNDNEIVRLALSHVLTRAGYQVVAASSGQECLQILQTERPHLILLDVVMPELDGLTVCNRIKADPDLSGAFVILFSGSRVASEDQVKGLACGADGYIVYPCGKEELLARVEAFARIQRSEQRLRESEERFRLIAETIQDVFWMRTAELERMVYVSPAYEKVWGRSCEDLYASPRSFMETVHPEDRETVIAEIESHPQSQWECEYRILDSDGTIRWIQDRAFPILTKEGKLRLMTGVARDITERRQAEEALQKAHSELERRVEERTADLVVANDRLNREIEEHKRTEEALQRSNSLLLAVSSLQSHYIAGTHPRILFNEILENMLSLTESEYGFIAEVMRASDGRQSLKVHARTDVPWKAESPLASRSPNILNFDNLQTLYGAVMTTGQAVISNCPSCDPRSSGVPTGHPPLRSFLGLPLYSGGDLVGVLGLANKPGGYDEALIQYLQPLLMSFGNVLGGHRNDLARRAAEEALSESEKRFRHIYDYSPVMMHLSDENGCFLNVNLKWLEETGYTREEVIGKRLDFLMPPDAANTAVPSVVPGSWREGYVRNVPYQFVRKDGSLIDVMLDGNITVEPSGQKVALNALKNITERKRAEEQLRQSKATLQMVFDGITEPLIMLDRDMRVRMTNRAAKAYYELGEAPEAFGKRCFEGLRGKSSPCEGCERPFSHLKGYTGSFERKNPIEPKKLERVVVYRVASGPSGEEASIVRISDITRSKLMERQLIQSEKLASLGLLISGIAHEINNPNNFMSFNIPILKDYLTLLIPIIDDYARDHSDFTPFGMTYEEFREDIFKLVQNMEHGSSRISATVSGLKDFVRKREKVEWSRIDIRQVVERAVTLCRSEVKKRVRSFQVDIPEFVPPFFSDSEALEQVLVNLLINAVHAVDKEDSWIRLNVLAGDPQVHACVIEVCDNGCGMDEVTKRKIFDPFFTTKSAIKGTGLGLSICHNLIEGLGGIIEVESEPGKGSTFRVTLYHQAGLQAEE